MLVAHAVKGRSRIWLEDVVVGHGPAVVMHLPAYYELGHGFGEHFLVVENRRERESRVGQKSTMHVVP